MRGANGLRVLIVTHVVRDNDGQGRVNYEIARAPLAAGHRVTILASMVAPGLLGHAGLRHVAIPVSRLPSRLLQYQMFALRTGAWMEALAAGLPVITAKTAGGSEVIDSRCGVVLDSPEDVDGLARAIGRVAGDAAYAREMGQAAREFAGTLTWQAMAERYLTLYDEIARCEGATHLNGAKPRVSAQS